MSIREITPTELQQLLAGDNPPFLIDVREEGEAAICSIDGSILIPMNSLPLGLQEIPRDRPAVLYCHGGMRSMMVGEWLSQEGLDALSLAGGIYLYGDEIETHRN